MTDQPIGEVLDDLRIDVVLAGFPKCGTTSVADFLEGTPGIELSCPKETFLLVPEFGREANIPGSGPFKSARDLRVEATSLNVYSSELLDALAKRDTKVVLILREPWKSLPSWHNQMNRAGLATGSEMHEHWDCGPETAETILHDYRAALAYGDITRRWVTALGHDRVLVLQLDDLADAGLVAGLFAEFLGIDVPVKEMPRSNAFGELKSGRLYRAVKRSWIAKQFVSVFGRSRRSMACARWIRQHVFETAAKETGGQGPVHMDGMDVQYDLACEILDENRTHWESR